MGVSTAGLNAKFTIRTRYCNTSPSAIEGLGILGVGPAGYGW